MQDSTTEILDPDQPLTLAKGITVTVRELTWKETKRFLVSLAAKASEFIIIDPETGKTDVNTSRLMSVVATDLGESLVMAATGMTQDQIDNLSACDMMTCIDRALALNLRPEMIESGKAIAGHFSALIKKKG